MVNPSDESKRAGLLALAKEIQSHSDWWIFPAEESIQGFMGTDSTFIVGDQPSRSEWRPSHPNRRGFYGLLRKIGEPNAHLTDVYKKRGDCNELRSGLPDDFQEHLKLFRKEIEILQPTRIVALGQLSYQLLMQHVPDWRPAFRRVWHFSYAVRTGRLSEYEVDMCRAIRNK
jgi:hypothetical protein